MYFSVLQYILLRYKEAVAIFLIKLEHFIGRIHFPTAVILPISEQV
jgi:hypothetical protein